MKMLAPVFELWRFGALSPQNSTAQAKERRNALVGDYRVAKASFEGGTGAAWSHHHAEAEGAVDR
jgi:hypothetical protein